MLSKCIRVLLVILLVCEFVSTNSHVDMQDDGEAYSTNYPRGYPANDDLTWTFTKDTGMWLVRFNEVDVRSGVDGRCHDDYIVVSDMYLVKHHVKVCGNKAHGDFVSKGPSISIRFQSGSRAGVARRGFWLSVVHGHDTEHLRRKAIELSGITVTNTSIRNDNQKSWATTDILIVSLSVCLAVCLGFAIFLSLQVFRSICGRDSTDKNLPAPQTVLTIHDCQPVKAHPTQRAFSKPIVKVDVSKSKTKPKHGNQSIGNDYVALKLKESGEDNSSARGILHSDSDSIAKSTSTSNI